MQLSKSSCARFYNLVMVGASPLPSTQHFLNSPILKNVAYGAMLHLEPKQWSHITSIFYVTSPHHASSEPLSPPLEPSLPTPWQIEVNGLQCNCSILLRIHTSAIKTFKPAYKVEPFSKRKETHFYA